MCCIGEVDGPEWRTTVTPFLHGLLGLADTAVACRFSDDPYCNMDARLGLADISNHGFTECLAVSEGARGVAGRAHCGRQHQCILHAAVILLAFRQCAPLYISAGFVHRLSGTDASKRAGSALNCQAGCVSAGRYVHLLYDPLAFLRCMSFSSWHSCHSCWRYYSHLRHVAYAGRFLHIFGGGWLGTVASLAVQWTAPGTFHPRGSDLAISPVSTDAPSA